MVTVSDITASADLFRRAYPSWPHAAPVTTTDPASQGGTLKTYDVIIGATHVYVEAGSQAGAIAGACRELVDSGSDPGAVYDADISVREI